MKWENWYTGAIIVVLIIVAILIWGPDWSNNDKADAESESTQEQTQNSQNLTNNTKYSENYYSDKATVMFFYSDGCSWCEKEKEVLEGIGNDGYQVKPMNIKDSVARDEFYELGFTGTPSFYSTKTKEKQVGFLDKEELKKFLDKN